MVYKTFVKHGEKGILPEYYLDFSSSFLQFIKSLGKSQDIVGHLFVDSSDGVGGIGFIDLNKSVGLTATILNSGKEEKAYLNDRCGAEFVQKEKKFPRNFGEVAKNMKSACFDGDADRLVYLYENTIDNKIAIKTMTTT